MSDQPKDAIQRRDEALDLARRYGQIQGNQHQAWVIDQMCRVLLGDEYPVWIADAKAGVDGTETYTWEPGIEPSLQATAVTLRKTLAWIDSVPAETVLPAMPGFDRDWVESLLADQLEGLPSHALSKALEMALDWVEAVPADVKATLPAFAGK